jgi:hypothetical protein
MTLPRQLLDPPAECGVMPFWFLNDALDEREMCRQIADFADHGVGGFVLHPRIGLPRSLAWMSDRLLDIYEVAIREAEKRGLRVVLYDEGMYPSGSSAGQVVAENPAYACRCLSQQPLDGDAPPHLADGENLVAIVARRDGTRLAVVDQPSGSFIRGLHFKRDIDSEWKSGAGGGRLFHPPRSRPFCRALFQAFRKDRHGDLHRRAARPEQGGETELSARHHRYHRTREPSTGV